jgi:hypothetical protein
VLLLQSELAARQAPHVGLNCRLLP